MPDLSIPQPPPELNNNPSIHDLLIKDIQDRKAFGLAKYGTFLQAANGRDGMVDALQEGIDLLCYLRKVIEERAVLLNFIERAEFLMAALQHYKRLEIDRPIDGPLSLVKEMVPLLEKVRKCFPRTK
jgi:hypothetical protein